MNYLVKKAFIDKYTNNGYNEGNTFVSDDIERVSFLIKEGYLEGKIPKAKTRKKASD